MRPALQVTRPEVKRVLANVTAPLQVRACSDVFPELAVSPFDAVTRPFAEMVVDEMPAWAVMLPDATTPARFEFPLTVNALIKAPPLRLDTPAILAVVLQTRLAVVVAPEITIACVMMPERLLHVRLVVVAVTFVAVKFATMEATLQIILLNVYEPLVVALLPARLDMFFVYLQMTYIFFYSMGDV